MDVVRNPNRGGSPPETLTPAAEALLRSVPADCQPRVLAEKFPRILNRMAEIWRRPSLMDAYFDELLVDTRGGRQGFPLDVLFDITSLKEHYQRDVFPRHLEKGEWDPRNRV